MMSDLNNPRVKFNISKYFEYRYGTQLCDVNCHDLEAVKDFIRDLDIKTINAM